MFAVGPYLSFEAQMDLGFLIFAAQYRQTVSARGSITLNLFDATNGGLAPVVTA